MVSNKRLRYSGFLTLCLFALSACFSPRTPQEVTRDFWEAVINNEPIEVVENSTLVRISDYDEFASNWAGFEPSWGEIRINGDRASVVSEFSSPSNLDKDKRKFKTYLVRQNKEWIVDYEKTANDLRGGAFGNLLGELEKLGDDLSQQLKLSSHEFESEMEKLSEKLKALSDTVSQQALISIERFAIELQQSIEKLEESINRALKDHDNRFSSQDRRTLQEVSADLNNDSHRLSQQTAESIVNSSDNMRKIQLRLESVKHNASTEYQQEWKVLTARIQRDFNVFLHHVSKTAEN